MKSDCVRLVLYTSTLQNKTSKLTASSGRLVGLGRIFSLPKKGQIELWMSHERDEVTLY